MKQSEIIETVKECAKLAHEILESEREKTRDHHRMSALAKQGHKDSEEFKFLKSKYSHPVVSTKGQDIIQKLAGLYGKF